MTTAHITEAQKLDPSALIELFTLDTSTCLLSATPGAHSVGEIYRWCSGTLEQREAGTLAVNAANATVVTVERSIPYDSLATYVFSVQNPETGLWTAPSAVAAISGQSITLAFPLPFVPTAGLPWNLYAQHSVTFNGNAYTSIPIEATGFEWNGQGKLPRPRLRVSNLYGMATGLLVAFGDLLGATVTRTRTFARFLDGLPTADPTAFFEADIFRLDRKAAQTPTYVEFELASELDQLGLRLPRRQMLRNTCGFTYRKRVGGAWVYGTCPYAGEPMFKIDNTVTTDPAQDVCDHHMTGCKVRFQTAAAPKTALPIEAFPGIALVRA